MTSILVTVIQMESRRHKTGNINYKPEIRVFQILINKCVDNFIFNKAQG